MYSFINYITLIKRTICIKARYSKCKMLVNFNYIKIYIKIF